MINYMKNVSNTRVYLSFFLVVMQSCFLAFFQGQGWVACMLLILLNRKNINEAIHNLFRSKISVLVVFFWIIMLIKGLSFIWIVYMTVVFFATIVFLCNYCNSHRVFINDLETVLKFLVYYSFTHIIILFLFKQFLFPATLISGIRPYTFFYLFFYNYAADGVYRIHGFCWEPEVWQIFLNIALYLAVIRKKSIKYIMLISLCVYFTHSTNGYVIMLINWTIFVLRSEHKKKIIPFVFLLSFLALPSVFANIEDKTQGDKMVSGLARLRDVEVGKLLIKKHPFIGTNPAVINKDPEVTNLKIDLFSESMGSEANELNYAGFEEDGFLNGFLELFLDWGVFVAIFLLIQYTKSPLLQDRKKMLFFSFIVFTSFFGEPLARTIFFYIFPFSTMLINNYNNTLLINENFNNHSDMECR